MLRSIISRLGILPLAIALAACSSAPPEEFVGTSTSAQTLMVITTEGAGPINQNTAYSSKAIQQALPGFTTDNIDAASEDRTMWTLAAFSNGMQVAQIYRGKGGKVGAVHGVTHHLVGPAGERIGMTFRQVGTRASECRVGRSLWRGMAICPSAGATNVKLVFAVTKFQGPFDRLPPSELLAGATLQRIIWTPPA